MPGLDSDFHLKMLEKSPVRKRGKGVYGMEWGNPDQVSFLRLTKIHYLSFFVNRFATVLEIGVGGGRWTRFMQNAAKVYAVDYHQEILDELAKNYKKKNIVMIKNNGTDFPEVPDQEIDFVFSFGTFVHLELDLIDQYLGNIKRLLKPTSNVVIHYGDKTKPMAQRNNGFSPNRPDIMLEMVHKHGYHIQDDNRWLLPHSAIVRFTL